VHEPVVAVAINVQLPTNAPVEVFLSSIVTVAFGVRFAALNSGVWSPVLLSVLEDPVSELATRSGALAVEFQTA